MNIIEKIKSFFAKRKQIQQDKEKEELLKEIQEIKKSVYESLPRWEDVPTLECLKEACRVKKKKILIIDDYGAITKLVKKDLNIIFHKIYEKQLSLEVIKKIETLSLNPDDFDLCLVSSELAPYIVYKSCLEADTCCFDYAIVDILYGDFIIKDGKKFYLDGIDIIELLKQKNPNIKVVIFTGCFLDNFFNKEKNKIIEKLGEEFLRKNVLIKTENLNNRLEFFIERLFDEEKA